MKAKLYSFENIRYLIVLLKKYFLSCFFKYLIVTFLLIICMPQAQAEDSKSTEDSNTHRWFVTVYGGAHWQDRLRDIFLSEPPFRMICISLP